MKPAWDKLAENFEGSSSVNVVDVDCTVEQELCSSKGVQGYPTIKYYKDGDQDGADYNGGRDFDSLEKFTKETLERPCDVSTAEGCSDKESAYITKMRAKVDKVPKELERLEGMKGKSMAADKKAWLGQRMHILQGLKTEL